MKRCIVFFQKKLNQFPLRRKLLALFALIVALLMTASFFSIRYVFQSGNRLLYQALAGSLSYSAADISAKLSNIESMSNAIVSNKLISKNLALLNQSPNEIARANAQSTLTSLLFDYHQSHRTNPIRYITLTYPGGSVSSYEAGSRTIDTAVYDAVTAAAHQGAGYTRWVTDYANDYGLFLGRDSRRINQTKMETLGTLVINVDMEKLIKTATASILPTDEAYFAFYDDARMIYCSPALRADEPETLPTRLDGQYAVLKLGAESYFSLCGTLDRPGWDYVCLIPYGKIAGSLRISFLVSAGILLLTAGITVLLSRRIIRTLMGHFSSLVYKMDAFGKNESVLPATDYDYSVRADEIGQLHNQFDAMAQKIQRLIQENYVNEILARDAQLQALQNQINPHFLYNTLESVNWRAKANGQTEISTMVEALGALLRTTLSHQSTACTLSCEMQLVAHYISIQKLRFEERLLYRESVDEQVLQIELPRLSIQPLVENAINYVLEEIADTCVIEVCAKREGGNVVIQVINSGSQFGPDMLQRLERGELAPHGFGIGLANIHKRIGLIYGPEYGLCLFNRDEDHAVAQICIPWREPC